MKNSMEPKSLTRHIVEDLEEKIISGTLKPGERIIGKDLCEAYGVSRSPVREAFRILESQGFIVWETRKGVSVTKISTEDIDNIYRIFAVLEGLSSYQAVKKQNPMILQRLKKLHARMIELAAQNKIRTYFRANLQFHETMINASENNRLIQILQTFTKLIQQYRLRILSMPERLPESIASHEEIIRAFESGDAEGVEKIRRAAIMKNVQQLKQKSMEGLEKNGV
jgi:DNA-binding GntR family transcriptional regulator